MGNPFDTSPVSYLDSIMNGMCFSLLQPTNANYSTKFRCSTSVKKMAFFSFELTTQSIIDHICYLQHVYDLISGWEDCKGH